MTTGWQELELGEVVTLQRGFDLPSRERIPGSVPIVSSSGTTGTHNEARVGAPGVVTGRYGTLGKVYFVNEPFWPLNTTLYVKDFHGNDPRFCFYFLQMQEFETRGGAAAVPGVNRNVLHRLSVRRPPLPTQRKIAAVLSAYDDLIEINNRRIKVLEEMAHRIYREWLVDFRYPGHEVVPLVHSELGPIPKNWEALRLDQVCDLMQAGGTPPRSTSSYWKGGAVNWFTTGELQDGFLLGSAELVTELAIQERKTRAFPAGTLLMAIYGSPTVGRLGVLTTAGACNQAALAMHADAQYMPQVVLYYALRELRGHFNLIAQGATQQNISKEKVAETVVVCPPQNLTVELARAIEPMWQQRSNLAATNAALRATSHVLLPRLISGDIDVQGLDIDMPGVAA